jgi:hypothetical protein
MIVAAIILLPILPMLADVFLIWLELILLAVGFITWLVWHFLSPKIASLMFHGRGAKSKLRGEGRSVFIGRDSEPLDFKATRVIRKSFYPLIFLFGTTTLIIPIFQYFGILEIRPSDPMALTANVVVLSMVLWPTISLFVVPIKWTIDTLNVRHFEHENVIVRALELSPYLSDFISFSVAYQFLLAMFTAGKAYDAILALIVLFWFMFPPTLLMTALYMRFSIAKHVRALQSSFEEKGYELSRKHLRLVEPAS